ENIRTLSDNNRTSNTYPVDTASGWLTNSDQCRPVFVETVADGIYVTVLHAFSTTKYTITLKAGFEILNASGNISTIDEDVSFIYKAGAVSKVIETEDVTETIAIEGASCTDVQSMFKIVLAPATTLTSNAWWNISGDELTAANNGVDIMNYIYINGENIRTLSDENRANNTYPAGEASGWLTNSDQCRPVFVETVADGIFVTVLHAFSTKNYTITLKADFALLNNEDKAYTLSEDVEFLYNAGEIVKVQDYTLSFDGLAETLTTTTAQAIGELPAVPAREGYTGVWTIDDAEITAETLYNYGDNKTAVAKYTILEYTITIIRASGTEETLKFNVENRADVLASVTLTEEDYEYAYAWAEDLPQTLELTDYTFTEVATKKPERSKFISQSLSIGAKFTMNMYVKVIGDVAPTVQLSFDGAEETLNGVLVDAELNKYVYKVKNISAEALAVSFTVSLFEGEERVDSMVYSVEEYLIALSQKEISNELKTLIGDLVCYGQAAEELHGKEDGIQAIAGCTATEYTDLTETDSKKTEGAKEGVEITSAFLSCGADNCLTIRFTAETVENLVVKLNGKTIAYSEVEEGSGVYEAQAEAVAVMGCNDRFKWTISVGDSVVQTLIYSVKSYVYEKQNGDNNEAVYAKALYNCSLSLKAYAEGV
ncbi:MAG: hypothetical protein IKD47_02320, partial [Clostridia bacterium]|nr:hypothetical protein [Clostridia bacterium]